MGAETCPSALFSSLILCCLQIQCCGEGSPYAHGEGWVSHPHLGSRHHWSPIPKVHQPCPPSTFLLTTHLPPSPHRGWAGFSLASLGISCSAGPAGMGSALRQEPPLHVCLGRKVAWLLAACYKPSGILSSALSAVRFFSAKLSPVYQEHQIHCENPSPTATRALYLGEPIRNFSIVQTKAPTQTALSKQGVHCCTH